MANTAKFNHLYTVDLVNVVSQGALVQILDYLNSTLKKHLDKKQMEHFITYGTREYIVSNGYRETSSWQVSVHIENIMAHLQSAIGLEWIHPTKGTFPKRFSSYLYKQYGLKLDTKQLSLVGTLTSAANTEKKSIYFDIFDCSKDKYWRSGSFGDSGSCLWSGKDGALDTFKHYKVMALRTYYAEKLEAVYKKADTKKYPTIQDWFADLDNDTKHSYGRGRAWMHYLEDIDAYIFWNGYDSKGELQAIHYARMWATISGMTYHKISQLLNRGDYSGTVYINSGSGWCVHSMDNTKAELLKSFDFNFSVKRDKEGGGDVWVCEDCGWESEDEGDFYIDVDGRYVCPDCIDSFYHQCTYDDQYYHEDASYWVEGKGAVIEGHRYQGECWYGAAFFSLGYLRFAQDIDQYIWKKDAYLHTDGLYYSKKPETTKVTVKIKKPDPYTTSTVSTDANNFTMQDLSGDILIERRRPT